MIVSAFVGTLVCSVLRDMSGRSLEACGLEVAASNSVSSLEESRSHEPRWICERQRVQLLREKKLAATAFM